MSARFLVAVVLLAAARLLIPTETFSSWPRVLVSAVELVPYLVLAVLFLSLSIARGAGKREGDGAESGLAGESTAEAPGDGAQDAADTRKQRVRSPLPVWGYVLAALLLVPATFAYDALRGYLSEVMPQLTARLDIWSLEALPVYALRPLALGAGMLVLFVVLWTLSFGLLPRPRPLRVWRLLSPLFWVVVLAGCLLVAYLHMVNYAQIHAEGSVYGMLFGNRVPESAWWYHLGPATNLVIYWLAGPMEGLLMGFMLLGGMRMLRAGWRGGLRRPET
ncbi:hypothetical protein LJC74_09840 [Eubacteriales bacterium OttesenSCG-928-A19]|nr:hypothetical protein [Eubacteriales bacterium OttesenSCG-928-A19]